MKRTGPLTNIPERDAPAQRVSYKTRVQEIPQLAQHEIGAGTYGHGARYFKWRISHGSRRRRCSATNDSCMMTDVSLANAQQQKQQVQISPTHM